MNNSPLISVLLVTYNQENFVSEALTSILKQDYPNFEVVISDDSSTDATVDVIKKVISSNNLKNLKIKFNINKVNLGISKNVELGLSLCEGDYICLAAGDDISLSSRLAVCCRFLEKNRDISAVFSNLTVVDEKSNVLRPYFHEKPNFCRNIEDFLQGIKVWSIGASLFFRKGLFSNFSPFINNTYQEDGVLAFRAVLTGGISYIDDTLVCYRVHSSNASQNIGIARKIFFKKAEVIQFSNMIKDILQLPDYNKRVLFEARFRKFKAVLLSSLLKIPFLPKIVFNFSRLLRVINIRK